MIALRQPGNNSRRRKQAGSALLMVIFAVATMLLLTSTAVLRIDTQGRREREAELAWRGEQYQVAIGRAQRFKDTTGIVHHMLQPNYALPPFAEPRIYNCGLDVPVDAIAPTRVLLEQKLGFAPMTERYFPPSIPYLEGDGSFGFMLHHNQPGEPDLRPRQNARAVPTPIN